MRTGGPGDAIGARATDAVRVCADVAALGPLASVEHYVGAGHRRIASALSSDSGFVCLCVRPGPLPTDPLLGWRIAAFYAIGPGTEEHTPPVAQALQEESYLDDPATQAVARDAERVVVHHDPDPRLPGQEARAIDRRFWDLLGLRDRMKAIVPVTPGVMLHFAVDRGPGTDGFDASERRLLEHVIEGLAPWAQRLALLHGFGAGRQPLTPRERDVACALLGAAGVKEFADAYGLSEARARELVRAVYKKLRVSGRPALAAQWSGESKSAAVPPIAAVHVTRRARR